MAVSLRPARALYVLGGNYVLYYVHGVCIRPMGTLAFRGLTVYVRYVRGYVSMLGGRCAVQRAQER